VPDIPAGGPPRVPIEFGSLEWEEEVERYDSRSPARTRAQSARKAIEAGTAKLDWKRCKADGPGGTKLPGCRLCEHQQCAQPGRYAAFLFTRIHNFWV
jgi:hypothetical protein